MANQFLFPRAAIDVLKEVHYNPQAKRGFDSLSGGFLWDDEFPAEVLRAFTQDDNRAFRATIAYRASLIREQPREELRATWEQLLEECPNWPGFRPERQSPDLKAELEKANARSVRRMSAFLRLTKAEVRQVAPQPRGLLGTLKRWCRG